MSGEWPWTEWPGDWPRYRQPCYFGEDDYCDMLVGPCRCGAWHEPGEFELRGDRLFRYGTRVDIFQPAPKE